jgi:anti-sigma-K factor RskA
LNIKEYISNGIVESYVLGLASEGERIEFEQLCAQYPELVEARTNFELALEKQAMESAETPPAYSKEKIWSAIQQSPASNTSKIITMESTETRKPAGVRWVAAASIILLLAAAYFAYDFYKQNEALKSSNKDLTKKLDQTESKLDSTDRILNEMTGTNVTLVTMKAMTPTAPSANIYWDSASSKVFLVIKNMPKLASDKQYQLWSLLDGKPSSIGLFDSDKEKLIFRMDNAKKADAFAITIEPRGNTGGPHLENLQTLGETKIKL